MKYSLIFLFLFKFHYSSAQKGDSSVIQSIYREALTKGHSYENLRSLCKDIGNRLSGTAAAQMAVDWGKMTLEKYGFDTVSYTHLTLPTKRIV